jgi:quercetin dioxygenase-like cupin family protein
MAGKLTLQKEIVVTLHKNIHAVAATPLSAGQGVSMKMLLSPDESPNFAMRNFVIAAGGSMPLHTNTVEHEQFVLSGRAKVVLGDQTIEAGAGDVLLIPAGVPHSYVTLGDEAYSFLCLVPKAEDRIVVLPD